MLFVHRAIVEFDCAIRNLNVVERKRRCRTVALRLGHELVKQVGEVVLLVRQAHDPELGFRQTNLA